MTETTQELGVVALITKLEYPQGTDVGKTVGWLVKMMMSGGKSPGFWSGEIIPPDDANKDTVWKLVQRFTTTELAKAWQQSDVRGKLLAELSTSTSGVKVSDELAHFDSTFGNVATAIVTEVKPGMEDAYFAWEEKIQLAQATFPGYRGSYLQPPAPERKGQWATLLRYDKPETLEKWFASPERKALLNEANDIVLATKFQNMSNSFPGWFPVDKEGKGPANYKTAMLVLLGLFPVVMLEIRFLSPLETGWNSSLSSFINLVLSVVATTWGTTPLFIKLFMWWLFPTKENASAIDLKGILIIMGIFAGEIALLWNLIPPKI